MILTPIKAYSSRNSMADEHSRDPEPRRPVSLIGSDGQGSNCKDSASVGMHLHHPHLPGCEGESGGAPLAEGDIPGQFTKVMGKGEQPVQFCLERLQGLSAPNACQALHRSS